MTPSLRLADVMPILRAIGATDAVLIGGQALNFWCEQYVDRVEALRAEGPFTSGDVDIQGDRDVVDVCARMLGARAFLPESGEDATNTGYGETRAALALNERIFRFCRSNMHARRALDEHGLDAFAAVDAHEGLPAAFNERRLPQMRRQLGARSRT